MLGPGQVADLRASVNALQRLPSQCVPEADAAVGSATTRGQQPVLVWRPGNGLHCCKVLCVLLDRAQAGMIPDKELAERKDKIKPVLQSQICSTHEL